MININNDFKEFIVRKTLLEKGDQITFFIDITQSNILDAPIRILYGDFSNIGIKQGSIDFNYILNLYDDKNEIGEVTGKKEHRNEIVQKLNNFSNETELLIPIRSETKANTRIWLNVYLTHLNNLTEFENASIVSGTIKNDVSYYEIEQNIIFNSYKDPLTRLFNRKTCYQHVKAMNKSANIYGAYIDLDKFKSINDLYGHLEGDETLVKFGKFLLSIVQEKLIFYRLAGDEFFVQIGDREEEEVKKIVLNILHGIKQITYGNGLRLTCSIGVVKYNPMGMENVDLITHADNAMYQSKYKGGNCITFITENGSQFIYENPNHDSQD